MYATGTLIGILNQNSKAVYSDWPPIHLHMIFETSSSKNLVWQTGFFFLFQTRFLKATQAVKIQFEIDKKSTSSNLIFQTRDFKNQVEMDGG